jgi:hypothetical protein
MSYLFNKKKKCKKRKGKWQLKKGVIRTIKGKSKTGFFTKFIKITETDN